MPSIIEKADNYMNILGNYCDDKETLAHFFQKSAANVAWKLFENQEDWIYMAGEKQDKPILRGEGEIDRYHGVPILDDDVKANMDARKYIKDMCRNEISLMAECMTEAIIANYYEDDIDLPEDIKWYYTDLYGANNFDEVAKIWHNRAMDANIRGFRYFKPTTIGDKND